MKKLQFFASALMLLAFVGFTSCSDDDDGDTGPTKIEITQAQLDAANKAIAEKLTGGDFPHGGSGLTGDQTYRDIYGSLTNLPTEIVPGTIITKHTWKRMGNDRDDLLVAFAMVKREAGYDTANKDWEYIMLPYQDGNDYDAHPFGMLADAADRGKLAGCIDCHAKGGGGDFLFVND